MFGRGKFPTGIIEGCSYIVEERVATVAQIGVR